MSLAFVKQSSQSYISYKNLEKTLISHADLDTQCPSCLSPQHAITI